MSPPDEMRAAVLPKSCRERDCTIEMPDPPGDGTPSPESWVGEKRAA